MLRLMTATSARLGAVYGRHWQKLDMKTSANYALFDMLDDVLSASSAVIVHSKFAKRRLTTLYGPERSEKVVVIPHLSLPVVVTGGIDLRGRINAPYDVPLIVTAGFATFAKRFDWLVAALNELCLREVEFFWLHAGKERPEEYALSELLNQYPAVKARSRITGYLSEQDLNACIMACDVLVNLRFPSVGESSGTLARAMTAGKCCVVSDTAAYAELPQTAVVHTPTIQPVPKLVEALHSLLTDASLRARIGHAARCVSETDWAPEAIASAYQDTLDYAQERATSTIQRKATGGPRSSLHIKLTDSTTRANLAQCLQQESGDVEIVFSLASTEELASLSVKEPRFLAEILPDTFILSSVRLEADVEGVNTTDDGVPWQLHVRGTVR
jgi:hypothetical protein